MGVSISLPLNVISYQIRITVMKTFTHAFILPNAVTGEFFREITNEICNKALLVYTEPAFPETPTDSRVKYIYESTRMANGLRRSLPKMVRL